MVKSMWEQQQAARGTPAPSVETRPTPPLKANPGPDVVTRPRGRPKTRLSTIDELAAFLQVSRSTVYRLIETQQLPHFRVGAVLRFDLPAVLRWAASPTAREDELAWQDGAPE